MSNITQIQVAELNTILNIQQDRGGFYLRLAEFYQSAGASQTAIDQIISQASITTGSGLWGGAAALGNAFAQEEGGANYDVTLDEFSLEIATRLFDAIDAAVTAQENSILNVSEIRTLDYSVWDDKGIGDLFPGQAQRFEGDDHNNIPADSVVHQFLSSDDFAVSPAALINGYAMASLVLYHADEMGAKFSDYGFSDNITPQDVPQGGVLSSDGNYKLEWQSDKGAYVVTNSTSGFTTLVISPDVEQSFNAEIANYELIDSSISSNDVLSIQKGGPLLSSTHTNVVLSTGENISLDANLISVASVFFVTTHSQVSLF